MARDPLQDHPDLNDPDWAAKAERAGQKHLRGIRRRAFWRRNGGRFLGFGMVVVLGTTGVVLFRAGLLPDPLDADAGPSSTSNTAAKINLNTPFLGTAAGLWPDGAAGIVVPETGKLGRYSAEQVRAFGEQVRTLLITARLDRRVIVDGQTEHVFKLLPPEARERFDELHAEKKLPLDGGSYLHTRISPNYRLLPVEPKVKGEMKLHLDEHGKLAATTNYSIAYAFQPEKPELIQDVHELIALQRREASWYLEDSPNLRKSARGLWWGEKGDGYDYLMSCAESDRNQLAPTYRENQQRRSADQGGAAKHGREHYFDPNKPIEHENGCAK